MPTTTQSGTLASVKAKLARGRKHRLALEAAMRRPEAYALECVIDEAAAVQEWRIASEPPDPPPDAALLIGDSLYGFRCALDHLAWELDPSPDRKTMFPLARCQAEFNFGRIQRFSDAAICKVVEWQPCFMEHEWRAHVLWALETLINVDKHRHLNLVASAAGDAYMWQPGGEPLFTHKGPVRRGTTLAKFASGSWQSEFRFKESLAFEQLVQVPRMKSAFLTLSDIDFVTAQLVNDFAAAFFPGEQLVKVYGER